MTSILAARMSHKVTAILLAAALAALLLFLLSFTVPVVPRADVVTFHNDNSRTGQNLRETILNPHNVDATRFGKTGFLATDGKVDAQPLYLSGVEIPRRGARDVLYVATEHDTVYAYDSETGSILWQKSMLGDGETPSDIRGCGQLMPEIGITATPVIDRTAGPNGAIYLIAMSKNAAGTYYQRLHALDAASGAELFGGPREIQASVAGSGDNAQNGRVIFDPKMYKERAALLLNGDVIYASWASHCDFRPYTGWVMAFNSTTLEQTNVLDVTPNGKQGGIWMSGGGPAADQIGNIFILDGDGSFDITLDSQRFPIHRDFGNAFLKLSTAGGLNVADYFEMAETTEESGRDEDLGSGGALVLPDFYDGSGHVQHLVVGAGKDAKIYVLNRDSMGKFNPRANHINQEIDGALSGPVFSTPAYFNNTIYFGASGDSIKAFPMVNGSLSTIPSSETRAHFQYPGTTPSISASGSANAILWAAEENEHGPAILHAFDAANLAKELYNSDQSASGRDHFGPGNKFITPVVVNGKVYVGTANGVAVFGMLKKSIF
jgi:outer membrane protein assembly factor BamB